MRPVILLLLICSLLTACAPTLTAIPTRVFTASPTALPTLSATPSQTLPPPTETETPAGTEAPTPTDTPIPLPLTPLPTFDKRLAHPIPHQPPAICPKADNSVSLPDVTEGDNIQPDALLTYLNAGGDPQVFAEKPEYANGSIYADVT